MKQKKWKKILALCAMLGMVFAMGLVVYARQRYEEVSVPGNSLQVGDILKNVTITHGADYEIFIRTATTEYTFDSLFYGVYEVTGVVQTGPVGHPTYNITLAPYTSAESCEHNYEWTVTREATMTQDGLEVYRCTRCGEVQATRAGGSADLSAYALFAKHVIYEVTHAEPNAELVFETPVWISCSRAVYEAIAARPDVTVTFQFVYAGNTYTTTIPAGADVLSLLTEDGYIGFLKLLDEYGGAILNEAE